MLVASHTCDLQDSHAEPRVALLVGHVTTKQDNNKRHAKGVRQLQLLAEGGELAEFDIRSLEFVGAEVLTGHMPWPDVTYGYDEVRSLQRWLAQRYERVAYPDEFVMGLQKAKLSERIRNRLKNCDEILEVRAALDESKRPSGAYRLALILIYDTAKDPDGARSDQIAKGIREDFDKAAEALVGIIDFIGASAQPDAEVPYLAVRRTKAWRLDDLSLRGDADEHPAPLA